VGGGIVNTVEVVVVVDEEIMELVEENDTGVRVGDKTDDTAAGGILLGDLGFGFDAEDATFGLLTCLAFST